MSEDVREPLIALLNQQLADTLDLYTQSKQAHWNVKGMQFIALHKLFDDLAEHLEETTDIIAERVTALGGVALGTARMSAEASRLPEYPLDIIDGAAHIAALADRFGHYAATTRAAIDTATDAGDMDTADLFTEISREIDKNLWFLEAHLQG
jgi:starvation-inducible DNA-binding protein